ncbi:electron transfer flavoprotein subunit beta [Halobacteriales archaeon QS_8_69_26]|nr:MAG: electron transfer flavoprotein subunit beta [Halobacteriales archaeon QS_8_69_26]
MEALACIKRVPDTGAKIPLTDDQQSIDTTTLGFTVSPHEECAVEEAVQQVETHGGSTTALTLGPEEASEQLYTAIARGADEGVLLEAGDEEWRPTATARAIADAIEELERKFDLLLFGNESADTENYQVGPRVANELDVPCVTGIKDLEVTDGSAVAKREVTGGSEVYEVPLPAVVAVKEGINSPRYPSMRSRMRAKRQELTRMDPERVDGPTFERIRLEAPETDEGAAEVLGEGPEAAPAVVDVLEDIGVL